MPEQSSQGGCEVSVLAHIETLTADGPEQPALTDPLEQGHRV